MRVRRCVNHPLDHYNFTVQPGMIFGYDDNNIPFVSNGTVYLDAVRGEYCYVYFRTGFDANKHGIWEKSRRIYRTDRQHLIDAIALKALKREGVKYQTPAQLESERWARKEAKNGGTLYNGCRSNHYGFSTERRPKTGRFQRPACYTGMGYAQNKTESNGKISIG